ncbi:hypothetical protein [uncultured Bradyrhizobium sp.]|uniref:hypothetical protein n=1 Tax=uncultured Bradyrhizobium sp. TaxID=199684 RepID=UPI0026061049|nr:hypothetical protein [uncultured Bradyrhizobium sp.]
MATANDIINRAARRIGVLAESEALSADALVDALGQLNEMLHSFGPRGIHYAHTTLAAGSDTVNVPDEQIRNVMLLLCQEMADEYAVSISQQLASAILDARQSLQAAYYTIPKTVGDKALMRRTAGYPFNIRNGDV